MPIVFLDHLGKRWVHTKVLLQWNIFLHQVNYVWLQQNFCVAWVRPPWQPCKHASLLRFKAGYAGSVWYSIDQLITLLTRLIPWSDDVCAGSWANYARALGFFYWHCFPYLPFLCETHRNWSINWSLRFFSFKFFLFEILHPEWRIRTGRSLGVQSRSKYLGIIVIRFLWHNLYIKRKNVRYILWSLQEVKFQSDSPLHSHRGMQLRHGAWYR